MTATPGSMAEYIAQEEAESDAEERALRTSTASITIRVPGDLKERLETVARTRGMSVSDLLRGYALVGLDAEMAKSTEQVIREEFDDLRVFLGQRISEMEKR